MRLFVQLLNPLARIPTKAYASAGYDLFPLFDGEIPPHGQAHIRLGFATAFDEEFVAIIDDRGSVGFNGVTHMAGVIDSDFRGEWVVMMRNLTSEPYFYKSTKGIAQVLFIRKESPKWLQVTDLPISMRGGRMLGSSD